MTKEAVTHMAWHPDPSHLLLAASDKTGRLALWQVDYSSVDDGEAARATAASSSRSGQANEVEESEEEGGVFDGVAVFANVHAQYVSALQWVGDVLGNGMGSSAGSTRPYQLLSASYDGSLRLMDVHQVCVLRGILSGLCGACVGREIDCVMCAGAEAQCVAIKLLLLCYWWWRTALRLRRGALRVSSRCVCASTCMQCLAQYKLLAASNAERRLVFVCSLFAWNSQGMFLDLSAGIPAGTVSKAEM